MYNINPLFILIPLLFIALMLLKPFRHLLSYFAKNIVAVIFFVLLSFLLSIFGITLSLNIFSLASTLLFGIPGIGLSLFMTLII